MKDNSRSVYYGLGLLDLMLVAFICLKLTGNINWLWVWVLCPFWIQFVFAALLLVAGVVVLYVANVLEKKRKAR